MKILALGDVHITERTPKNRTDDYYQTIKKKLEWIHDLCHAEKIKIVIQPGDLFDSWKESDFVKQDMLKFFKKWKKDKISIYTVFGQHDLRYHSTDRLNTPTAILEAAGVLHVLNKEPIKLNEVYLYGCSWGDEIPTKIKNDKVTHILAVHSMIIESKKLWPGQEDYSTGEMFLKKSKFDYVISGDNHKAFSIKTEKQMLINCGSLARSSIAQIKHKPRVWKISTKSKQTKKFFVPIEKEVLKNEEDHRKKENRNLDKFLNLIKTKTKINGLDFKNNILLRINELEPEIQNLVHDIMENSMRRMG